MLLKPPLIFCFSWSETLICTWIILTLFPWTHDLLVVYFELELLSFCDERMVSMTSFTWEISGGFPPWTGQNSSVANTCTINNKRTWCKRETRELTCNGRGSIHQHEEVSSGEEAGGQNGGEKMKVTNKEKSHLRGGENEKGEVEARRRERRRRRSSTAGGVNQWLVWTSH